MIKKKICIFTLLALCCISGCDRLIYSDLSDCPHGVVLKFHVAVPCNENAKTYPREINNLKIFVFDQDNKLEYQTEMKNVVFDEQLISTYIPVKNTGKYTFAVWGGAGNDDYGFNSIQEGMSKEEILLSLQKIENNTRKGTLYPLYYGANNTYTAIEMEGSYTDTLSMDLNEYTNRIRVKLKGAAWDMRETLRVEIAAKNTRYNATGNISADAPTIAYLPAMAGTSADNYTARFDLLKLEAEHAPTLRIMYKDKSGKEHQTGQEIDLVKLIMRGYPLLKNIECLHDFDVEVEVTPQNNSTYMTIVISVNGWTIHTYEIDLKIG